MKQLHDIPLDTFNTIEQFLKEEMSAGESVAFQQRMAGDQILQEQVDEMRLLFLGVQEATLVAKLTEFHSDVLQQKPPSTTKTVTAEPMSPPPVSGKEQVSIIPGHKKQTGRL